LVAKEVLISNLRQALNEMQMESSKQAAEKGQLEGKVERLSAEVGSLKESSAALREKLQESDKKAGQLRSRLDNVEV
jgi:predicted nuclease with TOPRIM domain